MKWNKSSAALRAWRLFTMKVSLQVLIVISLVGIGFAYPTDGTFPVPIELNQKSYSQVYPHVSLVPVHQSSIEFLLYPPSNDDCHIESLVNFDLKLDNCEPLKIDWSLTIPVETMDDEVRSRIGHVPDRTANKVTMYSGDNGFGKFSLLLITFNLASKETLGPVKIVIQREGSHKVTIEGGEGETKLNCASDILAKDEKVQLAYDTKFDRCGMKVELVYKLRPFE